MEGVVDRIVTSMDAPARSRLLVATPRLDDPNFKRTVVLLVEHTDEGSVGVVLNRPSPLSVSEVLPSWGHRCGAGASLLLGGPVEPEAMLAVAPVGPDDDNCVPIGDRLGLIDLSADPSGFAEAVDPILIFIGYAGWGAGQLDMELREGAWWVFDSDPGDLSADPSELWHVVLARQSSAATMLREHPDDPSLN
ncbi:MAG: YqgE/AlgH family protein [Actinomycetota bacterium]|jgi:putative transcriptional regulator|nr:YqgE/AlgH family protein [Actinomycetota bacterium]